MLRTRAPLCITTPFDLHVLGLPLAFILSQDQTLHCILLQLLVPAESILRITPLDVILSKSKQLVLLDQLEDLVWLTLAKIALCPRSVSVDPALLELTGQLPPRATNLLVRCLAYLLFKERVPPLLGRMVRGTCPKALLAMLALTKKPPPARLPPRKSVAVFCVISRLAL